MNLTHISLNTEWAEAFGFVIKLEYGFPDIEQPELEIFRDSEEARANDWRIYGVPSKAETDFAEHVKFSEPGTVRYVPLGISVLRIEFVRCYHSIYDYPRGGPTVVPRYDFIVTEFA
ncbi:hypothetical protein GAO09_00430 [Rhizobiales bacterium RZME27]|uniref:Uncharacterized protein n=1 Tax=Endobacterium cereale TaxID=2663029 RepID=A0A6A8A4R4_9HYPH|nr:hypothetical protein [Endobacterium cereale]MEB2843421.1 hypothetical protein [Endobacterium cereale]MQY44540.1 hypothetical protein [Endobacterium cereale]